MKPKQMDRYAKIDSCIVQHGTTQVQAASQSTPSSQRRRCIHPNPLTPSAMNKKNGIDRESVKRETALSINQQPTPLVVQPSGADPPPLPNTNFSSLATKQQEYSNHHTHTQQRILRILSP